MHPLKQCYKVCLLLVFGCLFLTQSTAQQVDTISLDHLIALAKNQALNQQNAKLNLETARLDFQIFKAGLLPQLRASANIPNYNKTFSEITQPDGTVLFQSVENNNSAVGMDLQQVIPGTGGTLFFQTNLQRFDDFQSGFQLYNGLPFRIGLSQPILAYNPYKWQRKLAPIKLAEAEKQYHADLSVIEVEATILFFDLLVATQELVIADANFTANDRLYQIAEERYALGKISRRDLMQLELERLAAQRNQLSAKQAQQLASADIASYLGQASHQYAYTPAEITYTKAFTVTEEQALALAKNNRPEWIQFSRMLLEAKDELAQAKRNGGPELQLTAAFGRARSSIDLSDIYNDALPETFVQLQINVPILDWGQRRKGVEKALLQQSFTELSTQRQAIDLEAQIRSTVKSFLSLQEELSIADQIRALAEERFQITTESYVLGAIPLTELTLAQREKDQTVRSYLTTLRAYWFSRAELHRLTLHDF